MSKKIKPRDKCCNRDSFLSNIFPREALEEKRKSKIDIFFPYLCSMNLLEASLFFIDFSAEDIQTL